MVGSNVRNGKTDTRFRPSFDTLRTNGTGRSFIAGLSPFVVNTTPFVVSLSNHGHDHPDVPDSPRWDSYPSRGATWLR